MATRFDFRGTDTKIAWKGDEAIELTSSTEERVKAAVDVFKEKLIRRDISMKAFEAGEPQASGKTYKVTGTLKQGISSETAKKITKLIRDDGPKNVKTQIQGDEVRVSSKKRDDLQAVIAMLRRPTSTSPCSSSTTGNCLCGEHDPGRRSKAGPDVSRRRD